MKLLSILALVLCVLALAGLGGCTLGSPGDSSGPSQSLSQTSQTSQTSQPSQPSSSEGSQSVTSLTFQAQYIRTNGYEEGKVYPLVVPIRSREQLDSYLEKNRGVYSFYDSFDDTPSFLEATEDYDDRFFSRKALLLVVLEESSGSIRHEVASVMPQERGIQVNIRRIQPSSFTQDTAQWHIIIELDADALDDDQIYSAIIT